MPIRKGNSLDALTEEAIHDELLALAKDRVIFLVAHKLNTVRQAGGRRSLDIDFLRLMEPVENSFLLMPYEDADKSIALLRTRIGRDEATLNKVFVPSKTSRMATKHIIYTERNTIEEIVAEIIPLLK